MKFEQKKCGTHITIELLPHGVKYSLKDAKHYEAFTVAYEELGTHTWEFEERLAVFQFLAFYFFILGVVRLDRDVIEKKLTVPLWLLVAAGFYLLYRVRRIRYTVLDCDGCRLYVIQDKYHDQILKTLQTWKAEYLRSKYARIDPDNDPALELRKLSWLKAEGIITDDEFEQLKSELEDRT